MTLPLIGAPYDRADGPKKVTGTAQFTGELHRPGLLYGELVLSTIANGRIKRFDLEQASRAPGVALIISHENALRVNATKKEETQPHLQLLQDDRVHFNRQPIAVIIAETLEQAKYAASLVRVEYDRKEAVTDIEAAKHERPKLVLGDEAQHTRGDPEKAFRASPIQIEAVYKTPIHHHNPLEHHVTLAEWDGDRLTIHDSTQYISGVRARLARVFSIPEESVRVVCEFVGGGFGSKGTPWSHVALAAMAAKMTDHPVRIELSRAQMHAFVGFRPRTAQTISLGAQNDGRLNAVMHDTLAQTAIHDLWVESSGFVTRNLYATPNFRMTHTVARLHTTRPTFTRAPGEASGTFAIESAMDELAYATGVDPIELRLRNYAEKDPDNDKPFSSKSLRECYREGARRFGWDRRAPDPRAMRNGRKLIGMGMATAAYPAWRSEASASIAIGSDGTVVVRTGTHELGTGSYTVFAQIAAQVLNVPMERVHVELGDTNLPRAPISAGSQSAASVGHAVYAAAAKLRNRFNARHDSEPMEEQVTVKPAESEEDFSTYAFGAQFAQVEVDPDLCEVRITKWTGAFACGRILNEKTARSQLIGGIVWGIGVALTEASEVDGRTGRVMSANLVDYRVPVNADVPAIDIALIEEQDHHVNPLGIKGIGEIGITGAAAAVANAVFHATGIRVRELPIRPERLLGMPAV